MQRGAAEPNKTPVVEINEAGKTALLNAEPEPEARFEGLGLGLGLVAAGILCWFLPTLIDATGGWSTAGRIAASVLFIVGGAGSLTELDKERSGFGDLAVTALVAGVGIGFLALATHVLHGTWADVFAVAGAVAGVFAVAAAGVGLGKMASPRRDTSNEYGATPQPRKPGLRRVEVWTLVLAALQVLLAAVALL